MSIIPEGQPERDKQSLRKAYSELTPQERLNFKADVDDAFRLQTRLDQDTASREQGKGRMPVVPIKPEVWRELDAEFKVLRLEAALRRLYPQLTPEYLEESYQIEQDVIRKAEAHQRALDATAEAAQAETAHKERLAAFQKIFPALAIIPPRNWAGDDLFVLSKETGLIEGRCDKDCKHLFRFDVATNIGRLETPPRVIYFSLNHRHTFLSGGKKAGGMKLGNNCGVYVDATALTCLATGRPIEFSRPSQEVLDARPLI